MKGSIGGAYETAVKRIPADAPGCNATGSRVADDAACLFAPLFTAPSFRTFCGLACGFLAQPGKRTVCGMLAGAGLSRLGRMTGRTGSSPAPAGMPDELGLAVARLVVSLLVPAGEPVPGGDR